MQSTTIKFARMATQFPDIERLSSKVIRVMGGNPSKVIPISTLKN
jgi:hypothetical protein